MAATATNTGQTPLYRFVAPRFWRIWIILGVMRLGYLLPLRVQHWLGRRLGKLGIRLMGRREIARRNIAACFPEWTTEEQEALLRRHFESLGIAILETAQCWWAPDRRLKALARPEGLEHMQRALAGGNGVIMLSAHFTCLEMGARLLCLFTPLHVMYRKHENPLWEEILRRGRHRHAEQVIRRNDVRGLLRSLRQGKAVWFAPDQAPRHKKDVALVPFFRQPALTNTSTSRIARITGAPVLPFFPQRLPDGSYRLSIGAPLDGFPSDDAAADAARFNALIEEQVRRAPEQYLWIHRRFKNRPPEYPDLYEGVE